MRLTRCSSLHRHARAEDSEEVCSGAVVVVVYLGCPLVHVFIVVVKTS